ncbi:hypothetical protein AVEN_6058-1 [Araneus ventricosus]|uniref:Uncharacterized protein n=1 Tax=Araneus ventricosus TaxID=182803 RepID=A0A4Y2G296_ARAVE|nr:hypothetical protein AVEN_6058-1 [Araneus ventricosus]
MATAQQKERLWFHESKLIVTVQRIIRLEYRNCQSPRIPLSVGPHWPSDNFCALRPEPDSIAYPPYTACVGVVPITHLHRLTHRSPQGGTDADVVRKFGEGVPAQV